MNDRDKTGDFSISWILVVFLVAYGLFDDILFKTI